VSRDPSNVTLISNYFLNFFLPALLGIPLLFDPFRVGAYLFLLPRRGDQENQLLFIAKNIEPPSGERP